MSLSVSNRGGSLYKRHMDKSSHIEQIMGVKRPSHGGNRYEWTDAKALHRKKDPNCEICASRGRRSGTPLKYYDETLADEVLRLCVFKE